MTTPVLGQGRFSHVVEEDNHAIKIIEKDDLVPPHNLKAEIKALQTLKHPNIITLIDITETNGIDPECKLKFPLYRYTLNHLLFAHSKAKFPPGSGWRNKLEISAIQRITIKLASALAHTHSMGIIHRDIKPENILFESTSVYEPILIDFGVAWVPSIGETPKITDVSSGVYKAPELLLGCDYNESIDIWSLGCVVAKLLSSDSKDLFGEYKGDIALFATQLCILGKPLQGALADKAADWNPNEDLSAEWQRLRGYAQEVKKMLCWDKRPSAAEVLELFEDR